MTPSADPSQLRLPGAYAILSAAIQERAFPGAAYGAFHAGRTVAVDATGRFTYDETASPVLPGTIFDLASVTKVVATTAMAMRLWERGQLDLEEPVVDRMPEFCSAEPASSRKRRVSPRMLLAHCSGLPAYARLFEQCRSRQELLAACLRMPLEAPPETAAVYSDIGFIVLGHLLEQVAGEALHTFCKREIFAPLSMESTGYLPASSLRPAIPPTALRDTLRNRLVQGEVHDENCAVLGGISGHAGLFSNVPDLLRFAECMLRGGAPVFRPETVALFTARQSKPPGSTRALGWDTPSRPSSSGQYFSAHSAGHLGYTGTSLWIDFEKELAVCLLTNRTFPGNGDAGSQKIQQVRPHFHDVLLEELRLTSAG